MKVVGHANTGGNVLLPEWVGHVSVLAAISTAGDSMPPLFVIEGVKNTEHGAQIQVELTANGLGIPGMVCTMSGTNEAGKLLKGSTSKSIWREYFRKIFFPRLSQAQRPALIIIDGHDSHFDLQFILECRENNVDVVQEPANCSSVLQALDQCCFRVLKQTWKEDMHSWMASNPRQRITKWHIPYLLSNAWNVAFSKANIASSFRKCGLYPFDPQVALRDDAMLLHT